MSNLDNEVDDSNNKNNRDSRLNSRTNSTNNKYSSKKNASFRDRENDRGNDRETDRDKNRENDRNNSKDNNRDNDRDNSKSNKRTSRSRSPIKNRVNITIEKPDIRNVDIKLKQRNQRMFGGLLSHLAKANKEIILTKESDTNKHKEELEKKISDKLEEEREANKIIRDENFNEMKIKRLELKNKLLESQLKKEKLMIETTIKNKYNALSKFIRTKTLPAIYYLPVDHNDVTAQLLIQNVEWHEVKATELIIKKLQDLDNNSVLKNNEDKIEIKTDVDESIQANTEEVAMQDD